MGSSQQFSQSSLSSPLWGKLSGIASIVISVVLWIVFTGHSSTPKTVTGKKSSRIADHHCPVIHAAVQNVEEASQQISSPVKWVSSMIGKREYPLFESVPLYVVPTFGENGWIREVIVDPTEESVPPKE